MKIKQDPLGIIKTKGRPSNDVIINVALINLLIEKGIITAEELRTRMDEIRKETLTSDPYGN